MACLFRNGVVVGFDSQRFWESTRRECHRVPESVVGLGSVLADQSRRSMTVIANCHTSMAGFQPAVVVFVHDVTVGAGRRIVGQVRGPASEYERVTSHPSCKANSDTERQPSDGYAGKPHARTRSPSDLSHGTRESRRLQRKVKARLHSSPAAGGQKHCPADTRWTKVYRCQASLLSPVASRLPAILSPALRQVNAEGLL